MSAEPQPGAFREQDGQVLTAPGPEKRPHPEYRWDTRIDRSDWTVRAAWRAGDPLDWPGAAYARVHDPTETIIVAEWGFLQTVIRVDSAELEATQAAIERSEVGNDA